MKIGIIGTGNMGGGLGKAWAARDNRVFFSARDAGKAQAAAKAAGHGAQSGTVAEAVKFSDVVLLATPWGSVQEALRSAGPLTGKVIIDCTNPLAADMSLAVGHNTSGAEEIAKWASDAKVVKAFNHVLAQVVAGPKIGEQNATVFYCGDDAAAKDVVKKLIADIGFEPVDAGPLKNARYIEPLAGLAIQLAYGQKMGTDLAIKLIRR